MLVEMFIKISNNIWVLVAFFGVVNSQTGENITRSLLQIVSSNCNIDEMVKINSMNLSDLRIYWSSKEQMNKSYKLEEAAYFISNNEHFNKNKLMTFYVPGFNENYEDPNPSEIREAYLKKGLNIFILNIYPYAKSIGDPIQSYKMSVGRINDIGSKMTSFLIDMVNLGLPRENINLIGFSLGAHLVGIVGRNFAEITGELLPRLVALDPPGACFETASPQSQVNRADGKWVEIYHCTKGTLGTPSVIGTVDFFPNGGEWNQPVCGPTTLNIFKLFESVSCSHSFCVKIWAESVLNKNAFFATLCDTKEDFKSGRCRNHKVIRAGFGLNPTNSILHSSFFFKTDITQPYGMGQKG